MVLRAFLSVVPVATAGAQEQATPPLAPAASAPPGLVPPPDEGPPPGAAAPAQPALAPATSNVVISLIRLLVQQGVLTQDKADALVRQAEDEAAAAARAQQATTAAPAAAGAAGPPVAGAAPPSIRVPFVPEIVKQQITRQVKQEVLKEARDENWASPNLLPEWVKRFHPFGEIRVRYEWNIFDPRNSNSFVNFQSINSGSPLDLDAQTTSPLPLLNTTADRQFMALRMRAGFTVDISDGFTGGLRLATGNTTNPVTTNQTLGVTLNKDNFLLDLAYLRYAPSSWATFWAGRQNNPWFHTDLVWGPDLAFDGVAMQFEPRVNKHLHLFFTAGAFPIQNTAASVLSGLNFNFPDNSLTKEASRDVWLYGAQAGFDWKPADALGVKFGIAYYDFSKIEGVLSSSCAAITASIPCDTDDSRPGFLQGGNTLFAIRNDAGAIDTSGIAHNYQYFGLASPFRELNATLRLDYPKYDPIHVVFDGDFVTNFAFNKSSIVAKGPVNNLGPTSTGAPGPWSGGANGFQARFLVGYPVINDRGDWNFSVAYKYIESDAEVDAYDDPDFHLGGTNAKGYIVGGNLGVASNIYFTARWLSASEISGLPYSVDVVQVDLNARF